MTAPVHPRLATGLQGLEAPAAAFEAALARGRLHHAWLLVGPQGVGKASFAWRAARRLLGARPDAAGGPLGVSPDDAVSRLVAARSHPDVLALERDAEDAPARKVIPVDEARKLPEFFAKAPALGPYRVAIVDAADDLNVNAANAVLKTLEEPSGRGVLFLISHAPGRLLPTIRSRCRRLVFSPWDEASLAAFGEASLGLEPDAARALAAMAGGAPGRMATLAASKALEVEAAARALMDDDGPAADAAALRLADGFRGGEGAERFALLIERISARLRDEALAASGRRAERLATLQRRAAELPVRVEALNLDRADAFWSLRAELHRAMGAG